MADPNLTNNFLIHIGDGATPTEAFSWLCGAKARSVTFTNNLGEVETLDCSDPTGEVAAIQRFVTSQDTSLTISGSIATTAIPTLRAWADDGSTKNIRIVIDESAANNGGYWSLPAILGSLEMGQESAKDFATFTAEISGAGRRSWTDAS